MAEPAVVMGAKGDFVWLIWERERRTRAIRPIPITSIPSSDPHRKRQGAGALGQRASGPPSRLWSNMAFPRSRRWQWNTGKLSAEEKKTLAMATEELKDMLQYGHLELADKTMDPGYIQHNPQRAARPRRLQAVHEPRSRAHAGRDQAGVEERAGADAGERPLLLHDVGPQEQGSGRSQPRSMCGTTTTWCAWRTA